jgi:hypothetical protein
VKLIPQFHLVTMLKREECYFHFKILRLATKGGGEFLLQRVSSCGTGAPKGTSVVSQRYHNFSLALIMIPSYCVDVICPLNRLSIR